jgi:hypothetical protein
MDRNSAQSTPELHSLSTFSFRRRTPGTFVLVPSLRDGRFIRCQGQLEAAAATILAACPAVKSILEQPTQIWYLRPTSNDPDITVIERVALGTTRERRRMSYIVPDFLVEMCGGQKHLIEIKPSARTITPKMQIKVAVGRRYAQQYGWHYHLLTERQLLASPLLNNVRLINRHLRCVADPSVLQAVQSLLAGGPRGLGVLAQTASRASLYHWVALGELALDPCRVPLSDDSIVYPGGSFLWDPFDSVWAPSGSSTDVPSGLSAAKGPINS